MTLRPIAFPANGQSWLDFVSDHAAACLGGARRMMTELAEPATRSAAEVLALWNDLAIELRKVEGLHELLAAVHPDEAVRRAADSAEQAFVRLQAERDLNRDVYEVLAAVDPAELDDAARRVLEIALRDFHRAGVDQPEAVRDRLREIVDRATALAQTFIHNITDDVRSVRVAPDRLRGLPPDFVESHRPGDDGLVTLTTEYPDADPVRMYAADEALRHDLCREFQNRGWPANEQVLRELLALRAEQARLLGYPSWADHDAEVTMAGSADTVAGFLADLADLARPVARHELEILVERRRVDDPSATTLRREDQYDYYAELVRRERFGVDAQQVREYFEFSRVKAGILGLTARLFGLEYREQADAPVWHEDVTVHDVYLVDGDELLGRIYLDLHPRAGKYSHAAMFTVMSGVAERHLPEVALVCNFPRGQLDHLTVIETFLHEFGHALHGIVSGRHAWVRFSGAPATELDFAEAPSQLLEEWGWDVEVLQSFATDGSGVPIPPDLVERMRAASAFGRGMFVLRDVVWSSVSHHLFAAAVADPDAAATAIRRDRDVLEPMPGTHSHANLSHLAEYASAYYTYPWSLAISKDLFAGFEQNDLFDQDVATRYRDQVLAPGGSRAAADLVSEFLGRPPSLEAFRRWLTGGATQLRVASA